MRVACYIDGFNLYHAIAALADPLLKWTDLRALAHSYLRDDDVLVRVVFSRPSTPGTKRSGSAT